jgi:hypothetical protein
MAKSTRKPPPDNQIGQLEDELKAARARADELKLERDEAYELVERMKQHVDDADNVINSWIEADQLELGDNGLYQFSPSLSTRYDEMLDKHLVLIKQWNSFAAMIAPRDVGRPLAASEAQCATVLKLHAEGTPLRLIVDETSLGLQTVRTIIGREHRTDRTSKKRMTKLGIDKTELNRAKARKRTRDALPKRVKATLDEGAELIREAKGTRMAALIARTSEARCLIWAGSGCWCWARFGDRTCQHQPARPQFLLFWAFSK